MHMTAWLAGFTRRWHTHPHLRDTHDDVSAHSGRMAVLALKLWPDASRDLLAAIAVHDLGESVTGDIPWGFKHTYEPTAESISFAEDDALEAMGLLFVADDDIHCRMKLCDLLDAYLWARHHKKKLLRNKDWKWARGEIRRFAAETCADLGDLI